MLQINFNLRISCWFCRTTWTTWTSSDGFLNLLDEDKILEERSKQKLLNHFIMKCWKYNSSTLNKEFPVVVPDKHSGLQASVFFLPTHFSTSYQQRLELRKYNGRHIMAAVAATEAENYFHHHNFYWCLWYFCGLCHSKQPVTTSRLLATTKVLTTPLTTSSCIRRPIFDPVQVTICKNLAKGRKLISHLHHEEATAHLLGRPKGWFCDLRSFLKKSYLKSKNK